MLTRRKNSPVVESRGLSTLAVTSIGFACEFCLLSRKTFDLKRGFLNESVDHSHGFDAVPIEHHDVDLKEGSCGNDRRIRLGNGFCINGSIGLFVEDGNQLLGVSYIRTF